MAPSTLLTRKAAYAVLCYFVLIASSRESAVALEIIAMAGPPNSQNSPSITSYSSISNFRSDTSGTTTNRSSGQALSCDFAITADGTFYYISGDATATSGKQVNTWPSVSAWASNSNFSSLGIRANAEPMSGMAIYQNELYILEGSMTFGGLKTLMKWSSIASWVNGDTGTSLGSRTTGAGIGFDIGLDGTVYFVGTSGDASPNTSTTGTLFTWPTISDFLANSNVSQNGGVFNFFGGSNQVSGLAVPEPSTYAMAAISSVILAAARHFRKRRKD